MDCVNKKTAVKLPALLVLVLLAVPPGLLADDKVEQATLLSEGDQAPSFELLDSGGSVVAFPVETRGKPSILFFWATWCPYCKALMPLLEEVRQEFSDEGVEVFALNVWEDGEPVDVMRDMNLGFRLLPDADDVAETYHVRGTPGLFVVDGQGTIAYRRRPSGGISATEIAVIWADQTRSALRAVLAKKDVQ